MNATKFKVLEVIIQNRSAEFSDVQVALMKEFPQMSWEEIRSFVVLLKQEGYIATLYGDNELQAVRLQPAALAKLCDAQETANSEQVKEIITRILQVARLLL